MHEDTPIITLSSRLIHITVEPLYKDTPEMRTSPLIKVFEILPPTFIKNFYYDANYTPNISLKPTYSFQTHMYYSVHLKITPCFYVEHTIPSIHLPGSPQTSLLTCASHKTDDCASMCAYTGAWIFIYSTQSRSYRLTL